MAIGFMSFGGMLTGRRELEAVKTELEARTGGNVLPVQCDS